MREALCRSSNLTGNLNQKGPGRKRNSFELTIIGFDRIIVKKVPFEEEEYYVAAKTT
jgi:hypothetical protein